MLPLHEYKIDIFQIKVAQMWDWIDWSKKQIAVEKQNFMYGLIPQFRIRQVTAISLLRITSKARVKAKNACLVFSAGHVSDVRPMNIEGGHLIGMKLGGVDDEENVVPMYSHVNRQSFLAVESQIMAAYQPGQRMGMVVRISYPLVGGDGRIPNGFSVQLYRDMVLDQNAAGTFAGTVTGPAIIVDGAPQQTGRLVLNPYVKLHLDTAKAAVTARGWTIESADGNTRDWVRTGKLPPVGSRPYAHLDYLAYTDPDNVLFPIPRDTVGGGWAFSADQRAVIQAANRYGQVDGRAGECWSDVAADPHQCALIQIGTDSGIEIDHIMPMSRSGSNAFSNAMVVSAGYNRSKYNTV